MVDVSEPTSPHRVGQIGTNDLPGDGLKVCGHRLVAWGDGLLTVVDLSMPEAPQAVGAVDVGSRWLAEVADVACDGDHVFVAHEDDGVYALRMVPETVATATPEATANPSATPTGAPITPPPVPWPSPTATRSPPISRIHLPYAARDAWATDGDDGRRLTVIGQFGGTSRSIASDGRLAVLGVGDRLHVLDVSQREAPRFLAQGPDLGAQPNAAALAGGYAWLAAGSMGLVAVDVRDPQAPRSAGRLPLPGLALDLDLVGGYAFVAASDAGVRVVDIADPSRPREVATIEADGPRHLVACQVDAVGELLAILDCGPGGFDSGNEPGVWLVDIADPAQPRVLSRTPVRNSDRLAIAGNLVLVVADRNLIALDVTDPAQPREAGRLYVGARLGDMTARDGLAVLLWSDSDADRLATIDTRHPEAMTVLATADVPLAPSAVSLVGDDALVAGNVPGAAMHVVDVADPAQPVARGGHATPLDIGGLATMGQHLLAVEGPWTGGRLWSLDATTADQIAPVARAELGWSVVGPVVAGHHAFVADGEEGLRVFDLSDPTHPAQIASVALPGDPAGMALGDGYVVVVVVDSSASYTSHLCVVDVTDPRRPGAVVTVPLANEDVWRPSLLAFGRYLYLAPGLVWREPLRVYRVDADGTPRLVGEVPEAAGCEALTRHDLLLYCASSDDDNSLVSLDLTDPAAPAVVASLPLPNGVSALAASDGRVQAVIWPGQLLEIDVRLAWRPVLRSVRNLPNNYGDSGVLHGAGDRLYFGGGRSSGGGITVFSTGRR